MSAHLAWTLYLSVGQVNLTTSDTDKRGSRYFSCHWVGELPVYFDKCYVLQ